MGLDSTCKSKARWNDVKGRTTPASRFWGNSPSPTVVEGLITTGRACAETGRSPGGGDHCLWVPHALLSPNFLPKVWGGKGPGLSDVCTLTLKPAPSVFPACGGPDQARFMEFTWWSGFGPWDGSNLDWNWSGRPWVLLSQPPVLSFTRMAHPEHSWDVSLL